MKSRPFSLYFSIFEGVGSRYHWRFPFLLIQSLPLSNLVSSLVSRVTKDGKRKGSSVEPRNRK